jgi:hypothetical protein
MVSVCVYVCACVRVSWGACEIEMKKKRYFIGMLLTIFGI